MKTCEKLRTFLPTILHEGLNIGECSEQQVSPLRHYWGRNGVSGLIRNITETCPNACLFPASHLIISSHLPKLKCVDLLQCIKHADSLGLQCSYVLHSCLGASRNLTSLTYFLKPSSGITSSRKPSQGSTILVSTAPVGSQPTTLQHVTPFSPLLSFCSEYHCYSSLVWSPEHDECLENTSACSLDHP